MALFRRALRFFLFLLGLIAGLVLALAYFFARRMVTPPRTKLWATPADVGMPYEEVHFPARDGVRIASWFIPASNDTRKGATLILVHGWPWNRLGTMSEDTISTMNGSSPVDFLRLAHSLHQEGFNLLMFDMRNHGESASAPPVTFGLQEANDVLGAVDYVCARTDVAADRVGAIGFSMGANAVLYAIPQAEAIRAAVAVQPTSVSVFAERYGAEVLGPLSKVVLPLAETLYKQQGGVSFSALQPAFAASGAGDVPILYVQGEGDNWGSTDDVAQMAAATPEASGPLFVESAHRYDGYQYAINNPKILAAFFEQHLPE